MLNPKTPPLAGMAFLALAALAAGPARTQDLEWLKKQTVHFTVVRGGEDTPAETSHGSGVVLCQQKDLVYILTAHHVLFGKSEGGLKRSRKDVRTTEIRFYRDLAPRIFEDRDKDEDFITPYPEASKDLALVVVVLPNQLPATASLAHAPTAGELAGAFPVTALGYAAKDLQGWVERKGEIKDRNASFLLHSAGIEEGFSGGPLFDAAGGLVGLNVQAATDPHGGDDAAALAKAVPIDDIKKAFPSAPPGCLEQAVVDNSEKEAFELYRQALEAKTLGHWKEAAEKLDQALEKKPFEGGSVHLQGMRYTVYLPHYQLGLVRYRQRDFQSAYSHFTISEVQGEIRNASNKHLRQLEKFKKRAEKRRREQPAPAAQPAS